MKIVINLDKWHAYAITLLLTIIAGAFLAAGAAPAGVSTHQTLFTDLIKGKSGSSVAMMDNVGIGTTNPTTPLDVAGSAKATRLISQGNTGTDLIVIRPGDDLNPTYPAITLGNAAWTAWPFQVLKNGNIITAGKVGIGTTTPGSQLDVRTITSQPMAYFEGKDLRAQAQYPTNPDPSSYIFLKDLDSTALWGLRVGNTGDFAIHQASVADRMTILNNGNVGIGTTNPTAKLDIAGTAILDYLAVDPQDTNIEGGEIQLRGAGSNGGFQIDNYAGNARIHTLASGKTFQVLGGGIYAEGPIQSTAGGIKFPDGTVQNTAAAGGFSLPAGVTIQGTAGRNYFRDAENAGNLRVGAAWGMPGIYAETGVGVLGGAGGTSLQNNALFVKPDGSGVGIGTQSPNSPLHVLSASGQDFLTIQANGNSHAGIRMMNSVSPNNFIFTNGATGDISFQTDNSDRMTVKKSGNVGIWTTNPAYTLDVNGDIINNWFRSRGQSGWYSQDYGGGWWMTDPWWVRVYGSKNVWVDQLLGSNAGLTVGYGGQGPPSTGAIIAGNVGIGTTTPTQKLDVAGNVKTDGIVFSDGTTQTTKAITGIWITPENTHAVGGTGCPSGYTQIASFADCGMGWCYGNQLVCVKYG